MAAGRSWASLCAEAARPGHWRPGTGGGRLCAMEIKGIQPEGWERPSGYSNGISVSGAQRLLFLAGQVAWDGQKQLVGGADFAAQFRQALQNVVDILSAAGGRPEHLVRLTVFVKDKDAYEAQLREVGAVWRELVGAHYPAMSLVQVADLLEVGALLEIEATAALPAAD